MNPVFRKLVVARPPSPRSTDARHRPLRVLRLAAIYSVLATAGSAAHAANEMVSLIASECTGTRSDCTRVATTTVTPWGVSAEGAFAFGSGYLGGVTLASASFMPGTAQIPFGDGYISRNASAHYEYTIRLNGPTGSFASVLMQANVSVSAITATDREGQIVTVSDGYIDNPSGTDFRIAASAGMGISVNGNSLFQMSVSNSLDSSKWWCQCQDIATEGILASRLLRLPANTDIRVEMGALAQVYWQQSGQKDPQYGSVSASADPVFTLMGDDAAQFQIVGIPDGPPLPAVPEPGPATLLVAGLGVLSLLRMRFIASSNDAPIVAFEPTAVLSWVECDPARRAPLVAGMAPKTLDQPAGALTLGLLERFGADKAVRSSLVLRFWTGVITGPVSVAHTKIRDTARRWQASATHPYVRAWTQELIDEMNASASQERIREERSF